MNAIIATLYVALTIGLHPISYGIISFCISEVLAFYQKKYIPGLVIGCCIANFASPMGICDIIFGTLSTLSALCQLIPFSNI